MNDPYLLLNIEETATDEQVRDAYHRQLRLHPPEHSPERFAAISEAYEVVRTLRDRVHHRLFGFHPNARCLDELVRDVDRRLPRVPRSVWLADSQRLWLAARVNGAVTGDSDS